MDTNIAKIREDLNWVALVIEFGAPAVLSALEKIGALKMDPTAQQAREIMTDVREPEDFSGSSASPSKAAASKTTAKG